MFGSIRCRLRDLGVKIGVHPTGHFNSITDVKGVRVGHCTIIHGQGRRKPGFGPIRTGVTAILPNGDIYNKKLVASGFILNGAGEVAGLTQLTEWGLIETPIALTNTMSVGIVSDSVAKWMAKKYHKIWGDREVVLPVVGECDDSFLNDSVGQHVKDEHVIRALKNAHTGPVAEGGVGAGTGMICCDFKAGIGTSSRLVNIGNYTFTIGLLVLANFGFMQNLRVNGYPVGRVLVKKQGKYKRRTENYGSIIAVIGTDLPLTSLQMQRICKRSALAIGRVGSFAAHGSGEIILGFSTANAIRVGMRKPRCTMVIVGDEFLNRAYEAVIDATEEAILNSLTASSEMDGIDSHWVPAIDLDLLKRLMDAYRNVGSSFG